MKQKTIVLNRFATLGVIATLFISSATTEAGEISPDTMQTNTFSGDFCHKLKSKPGTLYKNNDASLIQEFTINGRLQYQKAWVDGNASGQSFWYDNEGEFRRLRLATKLQFLKYFTFKGSVDLENDQRPKGGDLDLEYTDIYSANVSFDLKQALELNDFKKVAIGFGKTEIKLSEEVNTSSKKIKTIERSAIANKVFPQPNPTGVWVSAAKGDFSYYLGMYSTEASREIADWDQGQLYHARVGYDFTKKTSYDKATSMFGFAYADHKDSSDSLVGFDWVSSAAVKLEKGRYAIRNNIIVGKNRSDAGANRDGHFMGLVVMPTYWIVDKSLEAVFRYQYQHAQKAEGIRLNSRYVRNAGDAREENIASLRNGRGDEHHSFYLGMNYYYCGDHSKIMAGVEWEELKQDSTNIYHGFTYGLAYRMYF